jgi:hypothetical protein
VRNISFALTTRQLHARTKTVTRRVGRFWVENLKIGEVVMACEKTQGIKKGELVRICPIRIVDLGVEHLSLLVRHPPYGAKEVVKEGFPDLTPAEFVAMFLKHMRALKGNADAQIQRIEFEYVCLPNCNPRANTHWHSCPASGR